MIYDKIKDIIQCPYCGNIEFRFEGDALCCLNCSSLYRMKNNVIDFRLKKETNVSLDLTIGDNQALDYKFEKLEMNHRPEVSFRTNKCPSHLSKELRSYFPCAKGKKSIALDLGCGNGIHREVIEEAGFSYLGLDYQNENADILGDAHLLPFSDNTIEFVLSLAVLEHVQYPLLFAREIIRVLKPGGILIGTVAFLEAFHADSFYHHTHFGTYNTLASAKFKDIVVAPNPKWDVLKAQSSNFFPRLPLVLSRTIVYPIYLLHRLWYLFGSLITNKKFENKRILSMSASFQFIAKK